MGDETLGGDRGTQITHRPHGRLLLHAGDQVNAAHAQDVRRGFFSDPHCL